MAINLLKAQMLLLKCDGDEIWSVETCRSEGIPESWIEELADTFESGFDSDRNSIYESGKLTNQYHGVLSLQLAYKLAEFIGLDWRTATQFATTRSAEVQAIKEALEEQ